MRQFATNVFRLASMAAFLIAYGFGLGTIPWIIIAEIFPIDVRAVAVGQCINDADRDPSGADCCLAGTESARVPLTRVCRA